jgi:hypothetical protein
MATMDKLLEMSHHAREYIQGMPWEEIRAETGLSPNDAVYDIAYLDELIVAYKEALAVRDKLTLSYDVAASPEGLAAWEQSKDVIASRFNQFMAAVNANQQWLSGAPELHVETYRALVSRAYLGVVAAMEAHLKLILQIGGVDPALIVNSADVLYSACKGFVTLWDMGMLDPLKRSNPSQTPQPVSGLGITGFEIAAIVLASLAGVALICWMIYSGENAGKTAQLADDICARAGEERDPERQKRLLAACVEMRKKIAEELTKDPGQKAMNTAVTILSVGVIAYAGVLLLPHITRAFAKARAGRAAA